MAEVTQGSQEVRTKFEYLLEDNTALAYQDRVRLAQVMMTFAHVHFSPPTCPTAMADATHFGLGSEAIRDVLAERRRQVEVEGCTPAHDDKNIFGEMARAAACYAMHKKISLNGWQAWPWAHAWWKPDHGRRDLVKASALLLAEIERLDRVAAGK